MRASFSGWERASKRTEAFLYRSAAFSCEPGESARSAEYVEDFGSAGFGSEGAVVGSGAAGPVPTTLAGVSVRHGRRSKTAAATSRMHVAIAIGQRGRRTGD